MMSGNPSDLALHQLAYSLATDVIEFAAHRIAEMLEGPDKYIMRDWDRDQMIDFLKIYLHHVNSTYKGQIRSIKSRENNND